MEAFPWAEEALPTAMVRATTGATCSGESTDITSLKKKKTSK